MSPSLQRAAYPPSASADDGRGNRKRGMIQTAAGTLNDTATGRYQAGEAPINGDPTSESGLGVEGAAVKGVSEAKGLPNKPAPKSTSGAKGTAAVSASSAVPAARKKTSAKKVEAKPKNRLGQRARRKLAEEQFGAAARHVALEAGENLPPPPPRADTNSARPPVLTGVTTRNAPLPCRNRLAE